MKTDNSKKLRIYKLISILFTLIGITLMAFMVIVENEPGAIPLLLIIAGAGWYFITRFRIRSQHRSG
jgi:positive regulator of sigma E activity